MEKILSSLLFKNNVTHIKSETIHLHLLSHQEYPSLKSVTDTLDYFSIDNVAANVPKDAIYQLPNLFLALIEKEGTRSLVLVKRKKEKVALIYQDNTKEKHSVARFVNLWNGTIIAIEAKKKGSALKTINVKAILLTFIAIISVTSIAITTASLHYTLYTIASLIGIVVSYLIEKEELGINTIVSSKVCNVISKKADSCATVINSKEGKMITGISLADTSIIFFSSLFFITQFLGFNNTVLYTIALLTLPVIAISYYLQAFKLKQWCMLCLIVSVILISQFVILQTMVFNWEFSFNYTLAAVSVVLTVSLVWYTLKSYWKDSLQLKTTLKDYNSFKLNKSFLIQALKVGDLYNTKNLPERSRISFGATNPKISIHAITNPLCGFCKESFNIYAKLLKEHPETVQVNFIFNVVSDEDNKSNQISATLIDLYQRNKLEAFKALQDWFSNRDINAWQSMYGVSPMLFKLPETIINDHKEWCSINKLIYTPETIVNGYAYPKNGYELEDIQLFIEELKEMQLTTKQSITIS
jgi:uncharacterized membrane protein